MNDFSESSLRELFMAIQSRACPLNGSIKPFSGRPIFLRFDIDDNFRKAYQMSCICNEYGIKGTFFILNTAPYWHDEEIWPILRVMQSKGHEIGWHNNALTELVKVPTGTNTDRARIDGLVGYPISVMRDHGIAVRGSASHGDPLCHKLNYLNYEVFTECPRTEEAANFPACKFTIPKVSMHSFGLEYEAYHVHYDLYLSESGGREWRGRSGDTTFRWRIDELNLSLLPKHDRIQILIHPQHWKI